MTIEFRTGDILSRDLDVEALINTVNCVGVMGRGIALQFKNAFPDNFKAYATACKRQEVQPGRMFVFETGRLTPKYIINFPTKRHWQGKSRIEDIQSGLSRIEGHMVSGYADGGDAPNKQVALVPGAVRKQRDFWQVRR